MIIIKSEVEKRKADLQAQLTQLQANSNAISGAIQDCDYWLSTLSTPEPMADSVPAVLG